MIPIFENISQEKLSSIDSNRIQEFLNISEKFDLNSYKKKQEIKVFFQHLSKIIPLENDFDRNIW